MRLLALLLLAIPLAPPSGRSAVHAESPLGRLLAEYWAAELKHDPELASAVGEQAYDDQLSDYSAEGYNASLDRGRSLLDQAGSIDTAGLSGEEKRTRDELVNKLIQDQADAESKPWELPLGEAFGLPAELPQLIAGLSFSSQADYEHYLDRLKLVPGAFSQITTSLMTGMDDHHVLSKDTVGKVIAELNAIATQKPEESVFAEPLQHFPAAIPAAGQAMLKEATLKVITRQVLPAYTRLQKFLQAQYAPSAAATAVPASGYNAAQAVVLGSRARAEKVLGPKFDLKAFHEQVRHSILLSPDAMEKTLDTWITQQR